MDPVMGQWRVRVEGIGGGQVFGDDESCWYIVMEFGGFVECSQGRFAYGVKLLEFCVWMKVI